MSCFTSSRKVDFYHRELDFIHLHFTSLFANKLNQRIKIVKVFTTLFSELHISARFLPNRIGFAKSFSFYNPSSSSIKLAIGVVTFAIANEPTFHFHCVPHFYKMFIIIAFLLLLFYLSFDLFFIFFLPFIFSR